MFRTRVGYAGGTKLNPTYHNLGDHSETIQLDFSPEKISYAELLDVFWDEHEPELVMPSRQYMSIIFYHNDEQKIAAVASKEREQKDRRLPIRTEVKPFTAFYLAEDYHQKYYLQGLPEMMKEFERFYPSVADFVNSTAAARVNGYVGGYGTLSNLEKELDKLGLSPASSKLLLEMVRQRERNRIHV